MRLYLLRHGQTPANVAGELDTAAPGAGLTALGHRQAEAVPGALADEPVAGIHVSRLVRTQLTAAPLARARGLEVVVQPGLEEISAGDLEMRSDEESVQAYAGCVAAWMEGDLDRTQPGGQDGHGFLARYDAALREVASGHAAGDTVVVVSHGAAIRVYTALRAAGAEVREATQRRITNTGAGVLEGDPDRGWRLVRWATEPLGGAHLVDRAAHDVTGDSADEVLDED